MELEILLKNIDDEYIIFYMKGSSRFQAERISIELMGYTSSHLTLEKVITALIKNREYALMYGLRLTPELLNKQ